MSVSLIAGDRSRAATVIVNTASIEYDSPAGHHTAASNAASTTVIEGNSIQGVVRDENGMPVASALVEAKHSGKAAVLATQADTVVASAVTGADGTYVLSGLADGSYDIYISGAGITPEVVRGVSVGAGTPAVTLETRAPAATSWSPGTHMMALPFAYANGDPAAVFGRPSGLKLARWLPDQSGGRYVYYGQDAGFPAFAPGLGYWVQVAGGDSLAASEAGTPPAEDHPCVVPLAVGWNMVGNPFPADVEWAAIQVRANGQVVSLETAAQRNWVRAYAWTYNSATQEYELVDATYPGAARVLRVWQSCWLRALVNGYLFIPPPGGAKAAAAASRAAMPSPQWRMQLIARVGDLRDSFNYLGVDADSAAPDSRCNLQSPPRLSPSVDLSFADGRAASADFATYFQSPAAGRMDWDMVVRSDVPNAQVELTWPDLSEVPSQYRLTLIDVDANRRQYMRTTTAYVFNSGAAAGERHFKIEADPTAWARLQVNNLQQIAGRASGLTVSYDVSSQAVVEVEIRTLAGQLVRVLARGAQAVAGTNLISWDGADSSGRMMPAGPYLCSISAVTDEGQAVKGMRTIVLTR